MAKTSEFITGHDHQNLWEAGLHETNSFLLVLKAGGLGSILKELGFTLNSMILCASINYFGHIFENLFDSSR